jgi:hypothetical protein
MEEKEEGNGIEIKDIQNITFHAPRGESLITITIH